MCFSQKAMEVERELKIKLDVAEKTKQQLELSKKKQIDMWNVEATQKLCNVRAVYGLNSGLEFEIVESFKNNIIKLENNIKNDINKIIEFEDKIQNEYDEYMLQLTIEATSMDSMNSMNDEKPGPAFGNNNINDINNINNIDNKSERDNGIIDNDIAAPALVGINDSTYDSKDSKDSKIDDSNNNDNNDNGELLLCQCQLNEGISLHKNKIECDLWKLNDLLTNEIELQIKFGDNNYFLSNLDHNKQEYLLSQCEQISKKMSYIKHLISRAHVKRPSKAEQNGQWRRQADIVTSIRPPNSNNNCDIDSKMAEELSVAIEKRKAILEKENKTMTLSEKMRIKREIYKQYGKTIASKNSFNGNNKRNRNCNRNNKFAMAIAHSESHLNSSSQSNVNIIEIQPNINDNNNNNNNLNNNNNNNNNNSSMVMNVSPYTAYSGADIEDMFDEI